MNRDYIILLQNSMAHSTAIHLKNDEKVSVDTVVQDAIKIAKALKSEATVEPTTSGRIRNREVRI